MKKFFKFFAMTIGGIAIIGLLVWVVMLLWNAILPDLTGWNEIGYWQCAGLCLMFRLMTGHMGVSCHSRGHRRRKPRHLHEMTGRKYRWGNENAELEVEIRSKKEND